MHICDNRACINPDHLVLGTHRTNMADMKRKGRAARGQSHYRACMTPEKIDEAIRMRDDGASQVEIAAKLGVSRPTITRVLNGSYAA